MIIILNDINIMQTQHHETFLNHKQEKQVLRENVTELFKEESMLFCITKF